MPVYILVRTEHHDYYGDDKTIVIAHTDVNFVREYAKNNCYVSSRKINYEILEFVDGHETLNYFSIDA